MAQPMTQLSMAQPVASTADFISLMKPRVMSLVIFTAFVGMILANGEAHALLQGISLLAIACGAGAAGALNHWYDGDIDGLMARTAMRPVPQGRILPAEALSFGLVVSVFSVLILGFSGGVLAASLLGFTIFFYGVIYTMWLKRRTAQNIVIGGAAGAFPPLIGWLAAGGAMSLEPLILFGIIFIWTPPHFWSLALVRHEDYAKAGVPMLPVVAGKKATQAQILLYCLLLAPLALVPSFIGMASPIYGAIALVLGAGVIWQAAVLWRATSDTLDREAMRLFKFSILYLFLIFLSLGVDSFFGKVVL